MSKLFVEVLPRVVQGGASESGTFSSEKFARLSNRGFGAKKSCQLRNGRAGASAKTWAREARPENSDGLFETELWSYGSACSTWYCLSFR